MSLREVDALPGRCERSTDRMEGRLKVTTRTYPREEGRVVAEFVEGVLFRYTVSSDQAVPP